MVFLLLLAVVAATAGWRARDDEKRHHLMERRSEVVAAVENTRAQVLRSATLLTAAVFAEDPSPVVDSWREAVAAAREELEKAQAGLAAIGETDELDMLDRLAEGAAEVTQETEAILAFALTADVSTRIAVGQRYHPELWARTEAQLTDLDQLARGQQSNLAAERAATDRAAAMTLWLLVVSSTAAFVTGATAAAMLVVSVTRPLSLLRASVRAIRAGDLEARARVAGPEEVASLARDFNEMVAGRKRAEEKIREQGDFLQSTFDALSHPFYVIDANDYTIKMANAAARLGRLSGATTCYALTHGRSERCADDEHTCPLEEVKRTKAPVTVEHVHYDKDGTARTYEVHCHPIFDDEGNVKEVIEYNVDITERKRAEEALREQVRRDALTGVLNHGAIVEEPRGLIANGGDGASHAVAMVDVDGLKATNDTYGHQVGDAVLVAVAEALSRDSAIVGRYGGDEFVAVLPGADREAAERYRDAVLDILTGAGLTDPETGASVPVIVSVGLATYPTEAGRIEELIKLADSEMYAARRQRPVAPAGKTLPRPLGSERAAKMVGELVPLLTSPGTLDDKLRLVAHRLSVGAGYDGVSFQVYLHQSGTPAALNSFAEVSDELVEAWNREQRQFEVHPLRSILERTRRPLILDDPQHDPRLTDAERELVRAAGLRSALLAPMLWQNELIGELDVGSKREAAFGPRDAQFLMAVATQVAAIVHTASLVEELQSTSTRLAQAHTETVMMLAAAAEAHDRTTGDHLRSVRAISEALARELGYGEKEAEEMGLAAVLHDIGKIHVPHLVLASTDRLADEEWELMKQHTVWGGEFLAGRPGFELAAAIARSHHERWDGSGYPDGLSGEAIPEAATIVAVADAFDAMISDRPYRPRRSTADAVREIVACSGTQFSPRIVQALVRLHKRRMLPHPHEGAPAEAAAA